MSTNKEPENIFCSKHVLSVIGVLYITTISPAIDKAISEGLTRKEIGHLINSTIVGVIAGSLKILDKDVYTPKFLPGRNKDKALNNINEELLQPATNVIKEVVKEAVQDVVTNKISNVNTQVDSAINKFTNDTISSLVPDNNTISNSITRAVLPNVVNSFTDSVTSNLSNDINNTINNTVNDATNHISNLFRTSDVLKKNTEITEEVIPESEPFITNTSQPDPKYGNKYHPDLLINKQLTNIVIRAKQDTFYKFEPLDSSTLDDKKIIKVESGITIYIDSYTTNNVINNHVQFTINGATLYAFIPHITIIDNNIGVDKEVDLTPIKQPIKQTNNTNYLRPTIDQCEKIFDTIMKYSLYTDFINCLNTFGINTPLDVSHFLSHCAHESGGLRYMKEIGDEDYFSQNYDYREDLGNIYEGDGAKFSGVSPIQLTGRYNYQAFADFIGDQRVMEGVNYVAANFGFSPSGFWWYKNDMSNFINNEGADIYETTRRVNGGLNGINDRIFYFSRCKKIFNIA